MPNIFDQFDQTPQNSGAAWEAQPSAIPRVLIQKNAGDAIASIESGGNYQAIGPQTRNGDVALGKYQVMASNVGPWTKEVFGQEITPQQFLSDPRLQDAVFEHKFGQYAQKYGPEGAARAWFAGEGGMNDPNRRDSLGTSVASYANRFMNALGPSQANAAPANPYDQFDQRQNPYEQFSQVPDQPVVASRFGEMQQPGNQAELQPALDEAAAQITRGPLQSPVAQIATAQENVLPAATQGTNPNTDRYAGRLISKDVFQDELGNIQYRDPSTGALKTTDQKTEVAIRDPADGVVKIFSRSGDTNEVGAVGVSRVLAPGLAAGAPTARPAIAIASAKTATPAASDIFSTAKPYYRAFDAEAARAAPINADQAKVMVDRVQNALDTAHLPSEVAKQVHDTVALIGKKGDTALSQLQYVKRAVGNLFKSPDENVRNAAGVASKEIGRMISEASSEAGKNLKTADAIHATARSVQNLQRRADIANLRTGRAGYGGNAVNNMRAQIEKIIEADVNGRTTGFKPNEIQAMREIVDGTLLTNTARTVGAMAPSKGIVQIGAGAATGGISAVLGSAANKLATVMTGKQIERLNDLVAKRSPEYAAAVKKAIDKYENAQAAIVSDPSPAKFAAYVSASRALSAGLTRDGIAISSGDLLKMIQGPMKSAADEEQPPVPGRPSQ